MPMPGPSSRTFTTCRPFPPVRKEASSLTSWDTLISRKPITSRRSSGSAIIWKAMRARWGPMRKPAWPTATSSAATTPPPLPPMNTRWPPTRTRTTCIPATVPAWPAACWRTTTARSTSWKMQSLPVRRLRIMENRSMNWAVPMWLCGTRKMPSAPSVPSAVPLPIPTWAPGLFWSWA